MRSLTAIYETFIRPTQSTDPSLVAVMRLRGQHQDRKYFIIN